MAELLLRDGVLEKRSLAERAWKGRPQTVTVPYAKTNALRSLSSSTTRKVSMVGIWADHCPKLNTSSDR